MNHHRPYRPPIPLLPAEDIFCAEPYGPRVPDTCPHTYGVRVCSCAAIATEPCRPTACAGEHPNPSAYTTTANYPLLTANSSYTFSAKEKDSETGLSYFGSRYYSSDLSIWLSVDPMSDKYPSLSPYTYCANNPVKVVDPDGEDYEVVVVGNTITIKATYYTHPDNYNRVEQGVQAWNSQSGLYEYTTDDGKTYSVNFELKVVKRNSLNDVKDSQGSWNWVNTEDFKGAVRGDSDGHNISLDIDISNAPVRTVIHEIGHTLGIADDAYGVMESGGDSDFILDEHIMTILKGAKIQSTNGSSNNSNCDCTQKEGVNCLYENNQMSGSFRRKGL